MKNIKKKFENIKNFYFRPVTTDEVKNVIKDLKASKSACGEIPIQISTLICVGGAGEARGGSFAPPSWFSLNNSKTVQAVTLKFYSLK